MDAAADIQEDSSMPAKRLYPEMQEDAKEDSSPPPKRLYPWSLLDDAKEDSSPQAKRPRLEDDIACSRSSLSQVSLVWILWKGMTVSFC